MNSSIVVSDLGGCEIFSFNTLPIQHRKYVCQLDFNKLIDSVIEEFKLGPTGPSVLIIETPYFRDDRDVHDPWNFINYYGVSIERYYTLLLETFFRLQFNDHGVEIFF